jgi:hypothetical protein
VTRPLAVVAGFIGKNPVAGMTAYVLHHIAGLQDLGYDVHYVEGQHEGREYYNPETDQLTDDVSFGVGYLRESLATLGIGADRFTLIDSGMECHGAGWEALRSALARADFLMTLCDKIWYEDFALCDRRAFVDGDPMFTQLGMLDAEHPGTRALAHYDTLYTYATRMGRADCTVPDAGRRWLSARPVVATRCWRESPTPSGALLSGVMNWGGRNAVMFEGRVYGLKRRAFEAFMELPSHVAEPICLAVGGKPPKAALRTAGWRLIEPLEISRSMSAYHAFISGSLADFGIAKHAYVASRSGWFSDRSTCFLAMGRPVLHQDTGFGDWLPAGPGVLPFADLEQLVEAIDRLRVDYESHARGARKTAEAHFEASTVLGAMLDDAGLR